MDFLFVTAELKPATPVSSACFREMENMWWEGRMCEGLDFTQELAAGVRVQAAASEAQVLKASLPPALLPAIQHVSLVATSSDLSGPERRDPKPPRRGQRGETGLRYRGVSLATC